MFSSHSPTFTEFLSVPFIITGVSHAQFSILFVEVCGYISRCRQPEGDEWISFGSALFKNVPCSSAETVSSEGEEIVSVKTNPSRFTRGEQKRTSIRFHCPGM